MSTGRDLEAKHCACTYLRANVRSQRNANADAVYALYGH